MIQFKVIIYIYRRLYIIDSSEDLDAKSKMILSNS